MTNKDGKEGKNYYNGFDILKAVYNRYPEGFHYKRDSNMLRSEHIPFNLFIPLKQNREFCKQIFSEILGNIIDSIDEVLIEHAPSPKEKYLDDGTSFDTYIEYTHTDNSKGIIGIEVKYTEREYKLKPESKEKIDVNNVNSRYYEVSKKRNLYLPEFMGELKKDEYRQIWRNHLLAESILLADEEGKIKHAHSLIFYPKDNGHFAEVGKEYSEMLLDNKDNKFRLVTFENFIENCRKYCPNNEFEKWINYLQERYIIQSTA